jgi:GT2 family glycosyltransferase/SAM-dependent methyltransferase
MTVSLVNDDLTPADLTVVIPTRDRWDITGRTLAALAAQTVSGFRVVVVVDGLDQAVPDLGPDVLVVQVAHGGPGAARNAAVENVSTRLVLFLGDDMIPRVDFIEHHLRRHRAEGSDRTVVLGRVIWHPEVPRTPLLRWIDRTGMQFDPSGISGEDAGWGAFASCNVSMPAALFRAAGGFDPEFAYYYEDLDLAHRLREAGMAMRYDANAVTQHLHTYDDERFRARLRGVARGEHMMREKHSWFEPWFANRFRAVEPIRPPASLWRRIGSGTKSNRAWTRLFAKSYLDEFEAAEELAELKAYLGDEYDHQRLVGHTQGVDAEEHAAADEATFYRTSQAYLYDLTVFAMSGTKRPYRAAIRQRIGPGSRLLDYGCGIGSDGLRLIDAGYRVDFVDFANPSTEYLRWRLNRRKVAATIFDVEQPDTAARLAAGKYELVFCFDVIEHVADPFGFLAKLEAAADLVAVNFLEPRPDDVHVHRPLPVSELVAHAKRQGLLHYAVHYDRSHFVIYRARRADLPPRLAGAVLGAAPFAARRGRRAEV